MRAGAHGPCPFCGSRDIAMQFMQLFHSTDYWAECLDCGATGPRGARTEEDAWALFDRRQRPRPDRARLLG